MFSDLPRGWIWRALAGPWLVLLACAGSGRAQAPDPVALDSILKARVREERVDYLLLRKHDAASLARFLEEMAAVDAESLARDEALAYLLNLYNATMLRVICERFHAAYTVAEDQFAVFDEKLVRTQGGPWTLNELENKVIRPRFEEPRIHVALVCGARSCPPLLPRAYRAQDLDVTLEAGMTRFARDRSRNQIDAAGRTLKLSRIFEWYAADFGGPERVAEYLERYARQPLKGFTVGPFLDYSWELNSAPPAEGRWVKVVTEVATFLGPTGVAAGQAVKHQVFEVVQEEGERVEVEIPFGGGRAWLGRSAVADY